MNPDVIAYSPNTAAAATGTNRSRIFDALRTGELKARRLGRRVVIPADELKAWVDSFPNHQTGKAA